jgi:hypothetical protein
VEPKEEPKDEKPKKPIRKNTKWAIVDSEADPPSGKNENFDDASYEDLKADDSWKKLTEGDNIAFKCGSIEGTKINYLDGKNLITFR